MRKRGHLRISRKMFDGQDPIWEGREPFDRRSAWIDLCQLANYRTKRRVINGRVVTLERGQLLASERFLAQRWRWTRAKVRRFLDVLAECHRIVQNSAHPAAQAGTVITLCNYDAYNPLPTKDRPTHRPEAQPARDQRETKAEEGEEREVEDTSVSLSGSDEPNADSERKERDELTARRIRQVFDHWRAKCGHQRATLTKERRAKIRARLKTFSVEDLCRAVDAAAVDPFFQGDNDRHTRYDFPETIFKNDAAAERLMLSRYAKTQTAVVVND
jgi:hypothetical protein